MCFLMEEIWRDPLRLWDPGCTLRASSISIVEVPNWRVQDRGSDCKRDQVASPRSFRGSYRLQPAVTLQNISFLGEVLCGVPDSDSVGWCGYCIESNKRNCNMDEQGPLRSCSASWETGLKSQQLSFLPLELWGHNCTQQSPTQSNRDGKRKLWVSSDGKQCDSSALVKIRDCKFRMKFFYALEARLKSLLYKLRLKMKPHC